MTAWSPVQYAKFEDERSRPVAELTARIPLERPRRVVDIGCGPGNSTEILAARWPEAEMIGLDSSLDMLAAARQRLPGTAFVEADISAWSPDAAVDVLFGNAVFQWVPDHLAVLQRLLATLAPGGAIAVQMPDNLAEPSHMLMPDVALAGPWRAKFTAPIAREEIPAPAAYYDRLRPLAGRIDIWTTIYNHVLDGPAAILEWVKGTGLRPYLARLDNGEQRAWLADYQSRLAEAYPPLIDGRVLLRFPRLFVVAVRG
jgi:trans-aconitate 2-methyltransferase